MYPWDTNARLIDRRHKKFQVHAPKLEPIIPLSNLVLKCPLGMRSLWSSAAQRQQVCSLALALEDLVKIDGERPRRKQQRPKRVTSLDKVNVLNDDCVMSEMEDSLEPTFEKIVSVAHALGGAYGAEISIGYHAGVSGGKRWLCFIEADIHKGMFGIWSSTPQDAVELATAEALHRVPGEDNFEMNDVPEWYWRDAWVLASALLAGDETRVDLPDILGASRRTSNPSVFIDRDELETAMSRLLSGDLLQNASAFFEPSERARTLWQRTKVGRPTLEGRGFTKSLLDEMQSDGPADPSDVKGPQSWRISESTYLRAIQEYIERVQSSVDS